MSYFILMGRRIPKQAITGFKFQNETDNIRPFLSIRIRGKDEIIPFKDKKEIQSVKAHLCSIFSGFVKIGDWYLKMSEVKEYKPVTAEDMNPYILFKTSKFGNIKVRFPRDGTSSLDALNTQPFGFSVYAKPFLKRVIEYGNGETKVEYGRLNTEKGTYAHWLNCVTSISYNRYKQVMEVECNECTSKLFVDMIKSICNISEQVKSFVNPEQIKAIAESNEQISLLSNN